MATGYQEEVGTLIDYKNTTTPFGFVVRGPIRFDETSLSNSISFLGAAQSYGVWCDYPFPIIVSNALSLGCFNLGHAGAGPLAFADRAVIDSVNKTQLCVIQVMSGRSVSNRYMKQTKGAARVSLCHPKLPTETILAHTAYAKLHPILSENEMKDLVSESINNYIQQYKALSELIKVPKILLWISSRNPDYQRDFSDPVKMLGSFPHLIDKEAFDSISRYYENIVIASSSKFMDRPLWSQEYNKTFSVRRGWGAITTYTKHYSHPYLHILAAQKILEKVDELNIF